MGNLETNICDAIDIIVNHSIDKANFDRTIQATIVSCEDSSLGKYKIKYQDSLFYAYSNDIDISYLPNTLVYVIVPENNMKNTKHILGSVNKLGVEYINTEIIRDETFIYIGKNCVSSSNYPFGLHSYQKDGEKIILYSIDNQDNLLDIDEEGLKEYFLLSDYLALGANFQTKLEREQQAKGIYGLSMTVECKNQETGEIAEKYYSFENSQMNGTPYNFIIPTKQIMYYNINGQTYNRIKEISIYCHDFPYNKEETDADIFISDIQLGAVRKLTEEELNDTLLIINTPNGSFFSSNAQDTDTLTLEAEVRLKGKRVPKDSDSLKYYWFEKDASVTASSIYYCEYGGEGWHCLNDFKIIEEQEEEEKNNIDWNESSHLIEADWNKDTSELEWNNIKEKVAQKSGYVEWFSTKDNYKLTIKKTDIWGESQKYKCVVIYNDTILEEEQIVKNKKNTNKLEITSDEGVVFFYDKGNPTLTCDIYLGAEKVEDLNDYSFYWGLYDNNQRFFALKETIENYAKKIEYEAALQEIYNQINNEEVLPSEVENEINILKNKLYQLTKELVIWKNKVYDFNISTITNFAIFSCSVYYKDIFRGTTELKITNSYNKESDYSLIINNSNQIFKYNENGISPAALSMEKPQEIKELTFNIFDEKGNVLSESAVAACIPKWTVNPNNSLIIIDKTLYSEPIVNEDGSLTYLTYANTKKPIYAFKYSIANKYNFNYTNNTINLEVEYQEMHLKNSTNFTFLKEGAPGTNGTELSCRIIPNVAGINPIVPKDVFIYQYEEEGAQKYRLNYTPNKKSWFKVEVFENGECIFSGTEDNPSNVNIQWSVLQNSYNKIYLLEELKQQQEDRLNELLEEFKINPSKEGLIKEIEEVRDNIQSIIDEEDAGIQVEKDESNIIITNNRDFEYIFDINNNIIANSRAFSNIIQAQVTIKDTVLYATIPIYKVNEIDSDYTISIKSDSVIKYVTYSEDGTNPLYDTDGLFELLIYDKEGNELSKKTNNFKLNYEWTFKSEILKYIQEGRITYGVWEPQNLIRNYYTDVETEKESLIYDSRKRAEIAKKYNGYCKNINIECAIYDNTNTKLLGRINIPIHYMLNRYGQAALNNWNGNSIEINEDGGYILTPQIGSGKKEQDNSFTGIFMGEVETGKEKEIGLIGYSHGERSILLDAETGGAEFGTLSGSRIIFLPGDKESGSKETAVIKSGNYSIEKEEGMMIDLAEPSISYGSGNFNVSKEGYLIAKGGGSIAGWEIGNKSLYKKLISSNKYVGVSSDNQDDPLKQIEGNKKYAFWANGDREPNPNDTAPKFAVTFEGQMISQNALIGSNRNPITVGTSNNSTLISALYSGNKNFLESAEEGFYLGTDGLCIGGYNQRQYDAEGNLILDDKGRPLSTSYFYVTKKGQVIARDVDISGKITATSGEFYGKITATSGAIGGWEISDSGIRSSYNRKAKIDVEEGIQFNQFKVDLDGQIMASAGKIATWSISDNSLYMGREFDGKYSSGSVGIGKIPFKDNMNVAFWAGGNKFYVTTNGQLFAEDANIRGTIIGSRIVGGTIEGTIMCADSASFTDLNVTNLTVSGLNATDIFLQGSDETSDDNIEIDSNNKSITTEKLNARSINNKGGKIYEVGTLLGSYKGYAGEPDSVIEDFTIIKGKNIYAEWSLNATAAYIKNDLIVDKNVKIYQDLNVEGKIINEDFLRMYHDLYEKVDSEGKKADIWTEINKIKEKIGIE